MTKRLVFLILSVVMSFGQAPPAERVVVVENEVLRVSLSARNATLLEVRNKKNDASYLSSLGQAGWFHLQIPLSYWDGHSAASADLAGMTLRRLRPDAVEFAAPQVRTKEGVFPIAVRLTLRLEGDNLVSQLWVHNTGSQAVDHIAFPIVDVPAAPDGSESLQMPTIAWPLRLIFSNNEIRSERNPFDSLDPLDLKSWFYSDPRIPIKAQDYPMAIPTAWVAYVADGRGVGYDLRDKSFQFKKFMIERRLFRDTQSASANRRDYELSWNWYPIVRGGETWQSSEVYIKFGGSDWHTYAAQHRDWMRPWIGRPPEPETFKASLGWISRGIRSYDDIPRMAQQGVSVGAPYFIIYGWSSIGPEGMSYGAYPRTEIGGLEALQKNLLEARKLGSHPMAWSNETVTVETNLEHQEMGHNWVARDRWGSALIGGRWSFFEPFQIDVVPNHDNWLQVDPSSGAKEFMLDIVRRLTDVYHFSGYEMDQGHKNFLSYRDSNIPPPLAYTRGVEDLLRRAQQIVKANDPEGIIVGENPNEHMGQIVDAIWIFEGGALNVDLMSRQRYSIPWNRVSTKAVATDPGQANLAFLFNSPLDIFDDLTRYPEYAEHLRRLHALKKNIYSYFYQGDFSDDDGFALASPKTAGVVAKSYIEPEGKFLAVVVANTSKEGKQAVVQPAASFAVKNIRHYQLNGPMRSMAPASSVPVNLLPYDVQVLVLED